MEVINNFVATVYQRFNIDKEGKTLNPDNIANQFKPDDG